MTLALDLRRHDAPVRRGRASALAALSALSVLAGCGSTPSSPEPATAVRSLAWLFTQAFCTRALRCCSALERSSLMYGGGTPESCAASAALTRTQGQLEVAQAAIEAGRIAIDWGRLPACLEAHAAKPCSVPDHAEEAILFPKLDDFAAACPGLFVGRVGVPEECRLRAECAPGSHCAWPGVPDAQRHSIITHSSPDPGTCLPNSGAGERCSMDDDCDTASGLRCASSGYCWPVIGEKDLVCVGASGLVTPCDATRGLFCDFNRNTCQRHPRDGEPCAQIEPQCDPDPALGLACIGAGILGRGTCMQRAALGAACGAAALPYCAAGLRCRPTQADGIGVCDRLGTLGESCVAETCGLGTICDTAAGRCAWPGTVGVGGACTSNADCDMLACTGSTCANRAVKIECSGGATQVPSSPGLP